MKFSRLDVFDYYLNTARHIAKLAHLCNFQKDDTVLDIGCGFGNFLCWAAKICEGEVRGIEIMPDKRELFESKRKITPFMKDIIYETMNLDDLKVQENKYSLITMIDVIEHITEKQLDVLLPKICKMLIPNRGRFVCLTPSWPQSLIKMRDIKPIVITPEVRERVPGESGSHIIHYTLRGLLDKLYNSGMTVMSAFYGTKSIDSIMEDLRAPTLKELELTAVARKIK